jgi:hypothetical protein
VADFRLLQIEQLIMVALKCLVLAMAIAFAAAAGKCNMGSTSKYPPPADTTLVWHDINLDLDPKVRLL